MKIVVYTCITGQFEDIVNNQVTEGADFIIFTDQDVPNGPWTKRPATQLFNDPRRNSRFHKLVPHEFFPDYDFHVWMDGSIELLVPVRKLIQYMGDADILGFKHPNRQCAYEEAAECLKLQLDYPEKIHFHTQRLRKNGYPENLGLTETKVVVRRNTPLVAEFNQEWFYQLMTGSLRDQMSFDFAAWKYNLKVEHMKPVTHGNPWFQYHKHERVPYE